MNDYDKQVEQIQAYNKPILEAFEAWLAESWTPKTVKKHVDNIDFFTDYLVYYEPLRRLDEATDSDVFTFLSSWFPRKALWASTSNMKAYISSFKKFFKWMREKVKTKESSILKGVKFVVFGLGDTSYE